MGLGQGLEQRRGFLAGEAQVADQQVDRFRIQLVQGFGQGARAQQAMAAGGAEAVDRGQGLRIVVEQQDVQADGQGGCFLQARCRHLPRGDFRRLAQGEGHFLLVPRLGQVAEDAAVVERIDRGVQVGVAGEQDAQAVRGDLAGLGEKLRAAHLRHALVADDDLHRLALQAFQRAQRVAFGEHVVLAAELHGQAAQDAFFVVDEEDAGRGVHVRHSPEVGALAGAAAGSGSVCLAPARRRRESCRHGPG
ncbi:hypothetical protein D3C75_661160 [compost metagenome]